LLGVFVGNTLEDVPAFERWFGVRPVVDEALRAAVLG